MNLEFETDRFPVMKARFFRDVTAKRSVRVVVIHSMEAPEKGETAENVARFFQNTERQASAHLCIDNNSIVQCVFDNDIAFAAPGVNSDGIQLELAGFAKQTREQWLDPYGVLLLENAANATAQYCPQVRHPPQTPDRRRAQGRAQGHHRARASLACVQEVNTHRPW